MNEVDQKSLAFTQYLTELTGGDRRIFSALATSFDIVRQIDHGEETLTDGNRSSYEKAKQILTAAGLYPIPERFNYHKK